MASWHADRLRVYTSDQETWGQVDFTVFETIPSIIEAYAVRKAVSDANATDRPFVINFVFPSSEGSGFPRDEAGTLPVAEGVLRAALESRDGFPIPSGIGINCTHVDRVDRVISEWTDLLSKEFGNMALDLWVYPNGGQKYDPVARCWAAADDRVSANADWADALAKIVGRQSARNVWQRIIAGGCCKITPSGISALKDALESPSSAAV